MQHPPFTIKESLVYAWGKFKESFGFLVLLTLAFFILSAILGRLGEGRDAVTFLAQILNFLFDFFMAFTFISIGLKMHRGHKLGWNDVIDFDPALFGAYVLSAVVFDIAVGLGCILLVIPGFIVAIRLGFFGYFIVAEKAGPIVALKKSGAMTHGHFWRLFGFALLMGLINLVGVIAFGVGLLVTVPLTLIATVYIYETLKSHHERRHEAKAAA